MQTRYKETRPGGVEEVPGSNPGQAMPHCESAFFMFLTFEQHAWGLVEDN